MEKNLNMTQGKPMKLLISFALPLMFGNIFQQLYTVVDTAIVGRGVGMDALAALGSVDWLTWLVLGIAQGYTQGFSVRIAQKFGEKNWQDVKRFVAQSAVLSVIIAFVCLVVGQLGLSTFMTLLRVPADLWDMAQLYARIIFGGIVATMFYNYCASVLRAIGDSKTPLYAMIMASITNIVLDLIAVYVLHWGIGGAAAATVLAQFLAGVICCVKMCRIKELNFDRTHLRKDPEAMKNLIAIGSPAAAKNIIICAGGMIIAAIVNGFGTSFISGYTASNKLYGLLEIAAISYGYAVTTYVGQNYGANQMKRIKDGVRSARVLALATSVVIAVVMIAFGESIVALFITSEDAAMMAEGIRIGYIYLFMMAIFLPVLYLLYIYLSALQGMGDTIRPMISGVIELILRASIAIVAGYIGYELGVFGAEVLSWVGSTVYLMYYYHNKIKKLGVSKE